MRILTDPARLTRRPARSHLLAGMAYCGYEDVGAHAELLTPPAALPVARDVYDAGVARLATPLDGYAACCEAIAAHDEREHVHAISRPVLVVAGTHDPSPPVATAREYASLIRRAEVVELPAAHLSNVGATAAFNAAVLEFLGARK